MNEKELFQIVKDLNDLRLGSIKMEMLKDNKFIDQPIYKELRRAFRDSKYHQEYRWKWNQFVRLVLEDPGIKKHLYDKLLNLILKHRKSYKDYFILKTEEGTYW